MQIHKTPIPNPKNLYEFDFEFSHGDADFTSNQIVRYEMSDEQLIAYVKEAEKYATEIEDSRTGYSKTRLKDEWLVDGFHLPTEHDCHYDGVMAQPQIRSIKYYDENGAAYSVRVE